MEVKPMQQPGARDQGSSSKPTLHQQERTPDQEPVHNIELIARLLYAIGHQETGLDNEHELKKMLKKLRKPRLA
jgi:hypothetical protein